MGNLEGLVKILVESLDAPTCPCGKTVTEAEIEASFAWAFRPGNEEPMFAMCAGCLNIEMRKDMN